MAEFKYEVVADYAAHEDLKVRSVSYNGREPKFDIRHWITKDGKETMAKGVTLTIEELMWLAQELPKIVKGFSSGSEDDVESETTEPVVETEPEPEIDKTVELMNAIIEDSDKKGAVIKDGESYINNNSIILRLNTEVNADKLEDNAMLRQVAGQMENDENLKSFSVGEISKFKSVYNTIKGSNKKYVYSFGEGKPSINAEYMGLSLDALGRKAKYSESGVVVIKGDKGTSIILPTVIENNEQIGLHEVV